MSSTPYDLVIKRYLPKGWQLEQTTGDVKLPDGREVAGATIFSRKTIKCKRITDPTTLQVFLHEVAHVVLHKRRKRDIRQEYEAEMWSFAAMVREGYAVTDQMITDAKNNIALHLMKHPDWEILRWVGATICRI